MAFPKDKDSTVTIHHYFHFDEKKVLDELDVVKSLLRVSAKREEKAMADLSRLDAAVSRIEEQGTEVAATLRELAELLRQAGGDQAAVDALADRLEAKAAELDAAEEESDATPDSA